MSVLVPDHKVFSYIHTGLILAAYRTTCDSFYSPTIRQHFKNVEIDLDKESQRLVKAWLYMNEDSYNRRYKEEGNTVEFLRLHPKSNVTAIQLLKYLQCIAYNIEPTPQQAKSPDLILLNNWINDLQNAIISQLQEWKDAKWSEI